MVDTKKLGTHNKRIPMLMLRNLTSSDGWPSLACDLGAASWTSLRVRRTLRRNLGNGHVLIHQVNRTVATLFTNCGKATSAICYCLTNVTCELPHLYYLPALWSNLVYWLTGRRHNYRSKKIWSCYSNIIWQNTLLTINNSPCLILKYCLFKCCVYGLMVVYIVWNM